MAVDKRVWIGLAVVGAIGAAYWWSEEKKKKAAGSGGGGGGAAEGERAGSGEASGGELSSSPVSAGEGSGGTDVATDVQPLMPMPHARTASGAPASSVPTSGPGPGPSSFFGPMRPVNSGPGTGSGTSSGPGTPSGPSRAAFGANVSQAPAAAPMSRGAPKPQATHALRRNNLGPA